MAAGGPSGTAPPGWYADPGDGRQYRYWDGWAWTPGVAKDGRVTEQPITAEAAARVWADQQDHRAQWPARSLFIGVAGALVATALAAGVQFPAAALTGDDSVVVFIVAQAVLWSGLLLTCALVSRRYATASLEDDYALSFRAPDIGRGALISVIARVLAIPLVVPLVFLLDLDSKENLNNLDDVARGPLGVTFALVALLVGAPLVEELFFRGLLQRALESRLAPWAAIGIQALLFGVAHVSVPLEAANAVVFAGTFVAGVVLGVAVWRYHRLGPGIVAHSLFNLVPAVFLVFA